MITFTPDLVTNVKLIDDQHKELINRLNAVASMGLQSASKEETDKTLDFLGDYIVKHFKDEEDLQKKSGYPKFQWHHDQHQAYITEFKKLKSDYDKNGPSIQLSLQLQNSIISWIVKHIKSVDVELGKYINEHK